MTAIITKENIYAYVPQLKQSTVLDALLDEIADRATSIIEDELDPIIFAGYAASARTVYAFGSPILMLPPHQLGQAITVLDPSGAVVTGYTEQPDGNLLLPNGYTLGYRPFVGWGLTYYTVTASWGYGTAPDSLVEVCLELAVNIYREKEKGMFSDAIGVEGNGEVRVGYQRSFTNRQQRVLDNIKRKYALPAVV